MGSDNQAVQAIRERIEQAAQRVAKTADDIQLIAVSKQKPIDDIVTAYEAGVCDFGENRTEELEEKAQALSHLSDLRWHFIGQLQTRQSKPVAQYAHYFHAVDRIKIAERLSSQLQELDRELAVFVQVNTSGEESKGGFICDNWQADTQQAEALLTAVKTVAALPQLQVLGLMTMAPFDATEAQLRPIFQSMKGLSDYLKTHLPDMPAQQLSMGMSGDFEIAIEEGATHVRIGSAIFGSRKK